MRLTLSVVLALLLIILFSVSPIYSGCPLCDVTYPPMTGAGPGPERENSRSDLHHEFLEYRCKR